MSRAKPSIKKELSAKGLRFAIVVSQYNEAVTGRLLAGAEKVLRKRKAQVIEKVAVPGAYEIPMVCQLLASTKRFDALVALGAVVRGETPHFDYVAGECARGVMEVSLQKKIPIAFGVLTTNNRRQAMERAGGRHGNKGEEAAVVAIELARLNKKIKKSGRLTAHGSQKNLSAVSRRLSA